MAGYRLVAALPALLTPIAACPRLSPAQIQGLRRRHHSSLV